MGEVCEMFDVKPSLIRFWEQKFSIIKPDKNKKGNRLFRPSDVENLKLIYHLVKEKGMTLSGAEEALKSKTPTLKQDVSIVEKLQNIKSLLMQLQQELEQGAEEQIIIKNEPTITEEHHSKTEIIAESEAEEQEKESANPAFIQQTLF